MNLVYLTGQFYCRIVKIFVVDKVLHEDHASQLMSMLVNKCHYFLLYSMSNYIETLLTEDGEVYITICMAKNASSTV